MRQECSIERLAGLESLSYGTQPTSGSNTTRTQSYNARQQLATLQVGTALSAEFQYHADGEIRYAKDNTDAVKDRGYNYDQVGRLAEGLSGAEARGLTAADGIYRQSYQYDVWSNLTGRAVNRFWSGGEPFETSYVNNREAGGSYDANGSATRDAGSNRTHAYDAAGRHTRTSESSQASSWGAGEGLQAATPPTLASDKPVTPKKAPVGGYYTTTVLTIAQSYDGDGQSLKRVETKTQSTPFYQPVTTERVDYYVRSSVLGGKVVTELNGQGQKRKTNVYIGSGVAAEQVISDGTQSVVWKYSNPVTGTSAEQHSFGVNKKEYDPFGLELGTSDPYPQSAEPDYPMLAGGSNYRDGGNPFGGVSGCTWDGAPIRCDILFGPVFRHSRVTGDTSAISGLRWVDTTDKSKVKIRITETDERGNPISTLEDWSAPSASKAGGHWAFWMTGLLPQNPVPFDIPGIRKGLQDALKKWDCREFIQDMLEAVKSKKNPLAKSGDIMTLFESVVSGKGGFSRTAPPGSAGYGNPTGRISRGDAGIFSLGSAKHSASLQLIFDTETTLHELLHLAGSKRSYYDDEFATAVHNNPAYQSRSPYPPDTPALHGELKDPGAIGWGAYWGDVLRQKCFEGR